MFSTAVPVTVPATVPTTVPTTVPATVPATVLAGGAEAVNVVSDVQPVLHTPTDPNTPESVNEFCLICGDRSTGMHYGVVSCSGCKAFFMRETRQNHELKCIRLVNRRSSLFLLITSSII